MTDMFTLAYSLPGFVTAMISQSRRHYADPWDDWPNRNTGVHRHPVLYALWADREESLPIYVGQTVNMGKRLSEHFAASWWSRPPKYVTYLDLPDFDDPAILSVAEKYLMAIMRPTDNDPRK